MNVTPTEKRLIQMLRVPSSTGHEQRLLQVVEKLLAPSFNVVRIPVSPGRYDLLATVGKPRRLLAAHLDTVPGTVPVRLDRRYVHGRGACDNKGAAAAMITAALEAAAEGRKDFGLLLTVGEEVRCDGAAAAQAYMSKKGIRPDAVVIGEPTDLRVVTAQKGAFMVRVSCDGTRAHSSVANRDSAIEKLLRGLSALMAADLPETLVNVGLISGGEAANMVAAHAEADVCIRSSRRGIARTVKQILTKSGAGCRVEISLDKPAVDRTRSGLLRHEVAYFTEMSFLARSVVFGPGSITDAHSSHERISRAELAKATEAYRGFLADGFAVFDERHR
jgi:acetylornithine deacetylase